MRSIRNAAVWVTALLGACAWFLMSTASLARLPQSVTMLSGLIGLMAATAVTSWPQLQSFRGEVLASLQAGVDRRAVLMAAGGGVMAFWAAPALVLSQRSSDAPSGSETLLFSVVAFGVATVIASFADKRSRPAWTSVAAAVTGAAGAAGLLSNWERPSSFSPFVKFPEREAWMLVAAVVFALGSVLLARAEREGAGRHIRLVAVLSAGVLGLLASLPALVAGPYIASDQLSLQLMNAAAYAAFGTGWLITSVRLGPARAASALIVVPAAITALILAERALGVRGPDPIIWRGAIAGIAMCLTGGAALLSARAVDESAAPRAASVLKFRRTIVSAGVVALLFALATLGLPAIDQKVDGTVVEDERFTAEWIVPGYESGSGWAAFAAGICAAGVALAIARGERPILWGTLAVAGLASVAAMPFLGESTFATWNSWVPTDVQQAYGTEYARLTVHAVQLPARTASAVLSGVVLLACAAMGVAIESRWSHRVSEERSS